MYYAEVTLSGTGCDVANSDTVEVIVVDDPIVTLQPLDASYCQDAASVDELMIAVDGGTGTYSYQWYESTTARTRAARRLLALHLLRMSHRLTWWARFTTTA